MELLKIRSASLYYIAGKRLEVLTPDLCIPQLGNGDAQAHWKGAAEMILDLSDRWVDTDGSVQVMTQEKVSTRHRRGTDVSQWHVKYLLKGLLDTICGPGP
jgi:hypothetical protein